MSHFRRTRSCTCFLLPAHRTMLSSEVGKGSCGSGGCLDESLDVTRWKRPDH